MKVPTTSCEEPAVESMQYPASARTSRQRGLATNKLLSCSSAGTTLLSTKQPIRVKRAKSDDALQKENGQASSESKPCDKRSIMMKMMKTTATAESEGESSRRRTGICRLVLSSSEFSSEEGGSSGGRRRRGTSKDEDRRRRRRSEEPKKMMKKKKKMKKSKERPRKELELSSSENRVRSKDLIVRPALLDDDFALTDNVSGGDKEESASSKAMVADEKVRTFLGSLGLEKYIEVFESEEIDWLALRLMKVDQFKELGIPMGPRTKIAWGLEAERAREELQLSNANDAVPVSPQPPELVHPASQATPLLATAAMTATTPMTATAPVTTPAPVTTTALAPAVREEAKTSVAMTAPLETVAAPLPSPSSSTTSSASLEATVSQAGTQSEAQAGTQSEAQGHKGSSSLPNDKLGIPKGHITSLRARFETSTEQSSPANKAATSQDFATRRRLFMSDRTLPRASLTTLRKSATGIMQPTAGPAATSAVVAAVPTHAPQPPVSSDPPHAPSRADLCHAVVNESRATSAPQQQEALVMPSSAEQTKQATSSGGEDLGRGMPEKLPNQPEKEAHQQQQQNISESGSRPSEEAIEKKDVEKQQRMKKKKKKKKSEKKRISARSKHDSDSSSSSGDGDEDENANQRHDPSDNEIVEETGGRQPVSSTAASGKKTAKKASSKKANKSSKTPHKRSMSSGKSQFRSSDLEISGDHRPMDEYNHDDYSAYDEGDNETSESDFRPASPQQPPPHRQLLRRKSWTSSPSLRGSFDKIDRAGGGHPSSPAASPVTSRVR